MRQVLSVPVGGSVNWSDQKVYQKCGYDTDEFTTVLFIIENNWKPPGYLKKPFLMTLKMPISE